jgi:hypothetical protein
MAQEKLYTEEQVRQMLSIYMANVLLDVDGKMPTVDEILSYKTPIELPSDEEIKSYSDRYSIIHEDVSDKLGKYLVYAIHIDGAKWMKEQILNQNK